jgi:hypothetical protein
MQYSAAKSNVELGAKRVKVRYGPYRSPGTKSGYVGKALEGTGGMVWNLPDDNVQKPCSDCTITFIQGGLELPNGTSVNTNKGLWLHHMVALNHGTNRSDPTCREQTRPSMPHIDVGYTAQNSERFFSTGNERSAFDLSKSSIKNLGYYTGKNDKFSFIVDLMNENPTDSIVYMTMTYEVS